MIISIVHNYNNYGLDHNHTNNNKINNNNNNNNIIMPMVSSLRQVLVVVYVGVFDLHAYLVYV